MLQILDDFQAAHLAAWADKNIVKEERNAVIDSILRFLLDYPEVLETHTWSEIRNCAERYTEVKP